MVSRRRLIAGAGAGTLGALAGSGCGSPKDGPFETIIGTVKCTTGEPVAGVWIHVIGQPDSPPSGFAEWRPMKTPADASFRYEKLPAGATYEVHVGCGTPSGVMPKPELPNEWRTNNRSPAVSGTGHHFEAGNGICRVVK